MVKNSSHMNDVSSSGFEESGSDSGESSKPHSMKGRSLSEIISTHTDYKGLVPQEVSNIPQIDSDEEEVYLLKVPKSINPKELKISKFSLRKNSKVKTESEVYYIRPLTDESETKVFINSTGLKNITPISVLQLEKYVEKRQINDVDNIDDDKKPSLPQNLVRRHTLFGADFEGKINLKEEIRKRIQEALQRYDEPDKPCKKKKKEIAEEEEFEDKSQLISMILEEKLQSKRRKRSLNNDVNGMDNSNQEHQDISMTPTLDSPYQKKKKNHEASIVEIKKELLSESEIVENSKEKRKKKKHLDKIPETQYSNQEAQDVSQSPKKKRKENREETFVETSHVEYLNQEQCEEESTYKKKKKNREPSMIEIKKELLSESEIAENSNGKTKKKKHLKIPDDIEHFNQEESVSESPKKKKKKNRDASMIEVKKELLSESEMVEISNNKKRHRNSDSTFLSPGKMEPNSVDTSMAPAKRRKPSILSSTVIQDAYPEFKPDVSVIMNEKKTKKKNQDS